MHVVVFGVVQVVWLENKSKGLFLLTGLVLLRSGVLRSFLAQVDTK